MSHSGREGDETIEVDKSPIPGRPRTIEPETALEIVKDHAQGISLRQLAEKYEVGHVTIHRILKATDPSANADLTEFKRNLAKAKLRLSGITDQMLLERVLSGERVTLGELAVIGGIATQRALDIEKAAGSPESEQDWTAFQGWSTGAEEGIKGGTP